MENATKALLIAGGVLISIIVLSIGITLYSMYSNQSKQFTETIETTEIQKFNSRFEVYVGRIDITAQEIATVVNLAEEFDEAVTITIKEKTGLEVEYTTPEAFVEAFLASKFECQVLSYNDETKKVKEITFKEK